ncbi:MAG TPA: type IV pilus modification protein PilV [Lysobacter sp.]|nr:type IV pilus modification protein PilV [Lysobacter sp.]
MNLHDRTSQHPSTRQGFALVDVLSALIIMSVGMLGIAGLYVQSMQAGRTSTFTHHAVTLAGDVADRIRANPTAGLAYAAPAGANNNCVAAGTDCDVGQMAANDIDVWQTQAASALPNGQVTVAYDGAVVPPSYQITVSWDEPGEVRNYTITIPVLGF